MRLKDSIKTESKQRQLINEAKNCFKKQYSRIVGYTFFYTDLGLTENELLQWYKTQKKLDAILEINPYNKSI